ncbi:MAG: type II toxin-antitoxin system VapC family toxin [Alphaproteobacteria bacterium]|nr:type II toxin-antitoxin system VapC family toxin [Alphaproteobacteria bacterium]
MSYLVDTNVLSETLKTEPNKAVIEWFRNTSSESLYISVLTLGEIRKGIEKLGVSKRRSRLVLWLEQDLPSWFEDRILPIDASIAERWGFILARPKAQVPVIDSLIAATALVHNLKIVTRNTKDFAEFPDLEIYNPWD